MRIHLLAVGNRRPKWEQAGFTEYAQRLPRECALRLQEIPLARPAGRNSAQRRMEQEGQRLLKAIPANTRHIALDEHGREFSSQSLARQLRHWLSAGTDIALLIGGPDGLCDQCKRTADTCWSLSPLTLPHGLVRIVVAEQIYRAWTIIQGHPYHRD